jgi:uncharacterized membrane protein YjjP (DUF1212 family)
VFDRSRTTGTVKNSSYQWPSSHFIHICPASITAMSDTAVDPTYFEEDKQYILTLTKALLHFGSPNNRLESYLRLVAHDLGLIGQFLPLPGKVIVTITNPNTESEEPQVVEAEGHCSLSAIEQVHEIAHEVYKGGLPKDGIYRLWFRCFFAFFCSACFSILEFGGSLVDMPIAGLCSAILLLVKVKMTGHEEESVEVFE